MSLLGRIAHIGPQTVAARRAGSTLEPVHSLEQVAEEASRRRTFAIISHPDAGKTTLTEKFLLYSGQIGEAGSVKARSGRKAAT